MLTGEMPAFTAPAGQVDDTLREQLLSQKQNAALEALVAQLRSQSQPQVHAELIERIVLPSWSRSAFRRAFQLRRPTARAPS